MDHKIMPSGYELDDYWMQNVVLKKPKDEEDEFYSAYSFFHSSSLYPLPDYVAKKIAAAPPYNFYLNRCKNHAQIKKKKRASRNFKRSPLKINDQFLIKKPHRLVLGFKKQKDSCSWSLSIKENHIPETPRQKQECQTQKQLHLIHHSINSVAACNIMNRVPVLFNNQESIKKVIMAEMGGCDDLVFLIQKKLTATDLGQIQNRLSIPKSQVMNEFLNSREKALLVHPQKELRNIDVKLLIYNQESQNERKVESINLTCWKMNKSFIYSLNKFWYKLVLQYSLEHGMDVQLWAFRVQSQLCFALIRN